MKTERIHWTVDRINEHTHKSEMKRAGKARTLAQWNRIKEYEYERPATNTEKWTEKKRKIIDKKSN